MSIHRLPVFIAAARNLNFTKAAEELCISQTAISQQIKQLEQEVDAPLFVRNKAGLKLTPQGEIVVNYAVGDSVRIVDGPMNSLTGVVEELDVAKNSVTVRVSMFGREMPVELELDQVEALED